MKEKYNFGIVGCGSIGVRHCDVLSSLADAKLVAVCDPIKQKADEFATRFGVKAYYDYDEFLKDGGIDVVSICTPSGMHATQTIAAANSKKNVVCEKPMALSLEDCDAMISACSKNNVRLFVVKQNRHNEPIRILKEAIDGEKLGRIYMINANVLWNRTDLYYKQAQWRGTREFDGGALMNQSSHFVDLMHWLGGNVKNVYAQMGTFKHDIETEDTGNVLLKFENGAIGSINFTTCVYDKNMESSVTVLGTRGSVKIGGRYVNEIEHWNVEGMESPVLKEEHKPNDYGFYQGSSANHDKFYRNVLDVLTGKAHNSTVGSEGKKAIEIILAAKKSAEIGAPVELPLR